MTIIVWDGETLATDTGIWLGDVLTQHYNKIRKLDNWVFALGGGFEDYYKLEKWLDQVEELDEIDFDKLNSESSAIIFNIDDPKHYYENLIKSDITKGCCIGAGEEYAYALLQAGHSSEYIVRQCIKFHSGCAGRVRKIKPKDYFKWEKKKKSQTTLGGTTVFAMSIKAPLNTYMTSTTADQ